jgi:hypothetical protein
MSAFDRSFASVRAPATEGRTGVAARSALTRVMYGGLAVAIAIVTLVASLPRMAHAQNGAREAALILRILSYDRNLPQRASNAVVVMVVYAPGNAASEGERSRIVAAINQLGSRATVANMPARAIDHAFRDAATMQAAARSNRVAAIYVCTGLAGATGPISESARAIPTLTMSSDADSVRHGLGVALVSAGAQVRLIVNLPATEAQGARLDAAVLRLAEIIR